MLVPVLVHLALASEPKLATKASVHQLPNGLTVILEEDHKTDTIGLHIRYGVGARDESDGEHGCAHLFEHLMFEGSRNVPTNKFDEWLTAAGGENNAFTSEDQTAYHMSFPSGALDMALFLESDRLGFLDAGIVPDNVKNQQLVVLQERNEGYADPHGRDYDALTRLLFPKGNPYHVPVIGTVADIEGFEADKVLDFWKRHYRPRNAVLALVGNFESDKALERIRYWFSDVPDVGPALPRATSTEVRATRTDGYLQDAVEDRTVYLAWPTVPLGHPDEPALDLLGNVLSNGQGTRLADRLYYDSSLALDQGAFFYGSEIDGSFIAVASSPKTPLARLAKEIEKVIADVVRHPPTDAELSRAKKSVRSGLLDALEDPMSRARIYTDCHVQTGAPNCLSAEWDRYEKVTAADITRVITTWIKPETRVSLSVVPEGDRRFLRGATAVELP